MTAYAPTWTGRLKVSYFAAGAVHTQTWRYPGPSSGSGVTDLVAVLTDYYAALNAILWDDFVINAVEVADVDTAFFLPIINPFTAVDGATAIAGLVPEDKAFSVQFVGRTTGGNPWKISQYGVVHTALEADGGHNFRCLGGENADMDNTFAVLQAAAGTILGNDANSVAVYNYADLAYNNRWKKKVRRGA